MEIRQGLATRLSSGAAWRAALSAEHPEDDGNRRSAYALTELADHVMALSADDSRLEALAALSFDEHAFPSVGDEVDRLIARYGANRHMQPHPDTFLRDLVGIANRTAGESRRNMREAASARAQVALAAPPHVPDGAGKLGDPVASVAGPASPAGSSGQPELGALGGSVDPAQAYGPPSMWEFRPPHPLGDATITEMVLDG